MLQLNCTVSPVGLFLQMLDKVIIYVVWNAVDLYILNMNLTNRRLHSISNADTRFTCRLLAYAAVRNSV